MTGSAGKSVKPRVLLSWSSGKDSAWSLHVLRSQRGTDAVDVVGLLTTVNAAFDRVAMHGVRRELLEAQAQAVGLPMIAVPIPWPCTNADYEAAFLSALDRARAEVGVSHVAFGDLFLEDVRAYREQLLQGTGLAPIFPIWGRPTRELAEQMVAEGLAAIITCVDPSCLDRSFAGRSFDAQLLAELPEDVDPCGERGEFHTYASGGPMFRTSIRTVVGEVVERDGFVFADLVRIDSPDTNSSSIFDTDGSLSREFLLSRGICCGNRCRNCPYEWTAVLKGSAS